MAGGAGYCDGGGALSRAAADGPPNIDDIDIVLFTLPGRFIDDSEGRSRLEGKPRGGPSGG